MHIFAADGRAGRARTWMLATSVLALSATSASAAPLLPGYFTGDATAAFADASTGVLSLELTHLAHSNCPCAGTNGHEVVNRVGPVGIPGVATVTLTVAKSIGSRTSTDAVATESARLEGVSLLGGLIHASALKAEATVHASDRKLLTLTDGSHFTKLVVAGQAMADSPPENTVVPVPGVGSVTLNQVTHSGDGTEKAGLRVAMLTLTVSEANSFGLPLGATVIIGEANVSYDRKQPHRVVSGNANVADTNAVAMAALPGLGPLAPVVIDNCAGVPGKPGNSVAALSVGPVSIGAGTTTAQGGRTGPDQSMAQTTATVGSISLLGLIGAGSITSVATETVSGGKVTASSSGTQFGGLTVAGVTLPADVPANTKVTLPLLGYVMVNEQIAPLPGRAGPLTVNGLHVVITSANLMNLPVGAEIIVAHATAQASKLPE